MNHNYYQIIGLVFLLFVEGLSASNVIYQARYVEDAAGNRELISQGFVAGRPELIRNDVEEIRYPESFVEHEDVTQRWIIELKAISKEPIENLLKDRSVEVRRPSNDRDREEVFTLVNSGPSSNRIDLVLMGDGYTLNERDKFISDMNRLTDEIFRGKTFHSYLPIFNVHAVFKPSEESGIGKNDTPKNTAYGLYRQGNTLRAIFVSKPGAVDISCSKAPGCDYPIVVGNDPYYGGLGGRFSITTSSPTSGSVVLRHELGHSVGLVGEEYDGGGYFGANHSASINGATWKHWLSGELTAEPSVARYVNWMWKNLGTSPFSLSFNSNGNFFHTSIHFGAAGVETDKDLKISLDKKDIAIKGLGHSDRDFFEVELPSGLSQGAHELKFFEGVADANNTLTDLTIHEFGQGYHFQDGYINAFPLFQKNLSQDGYRPTHNTCLMRRMKSNRFCSVCQENNWLKFFTKISMIDGVDVRTESGTTIVALRTPALGQLRRPHPRATEQVKVQWYRNEQLVANLTDLLSWSKQTSDATGKWTVNVEFLTPEVRKDSGKVLKASKSFSI